MNPQMQALQGIIQEYMTLASEVRNDQNLGPTTKAQVLLQMSQSLAALVPLTTNDAQAELEMKAQEHQMNLQAKQAEMGMKQQEHQMKMQHSQSENEMKLQQAQQNHANNLVQSQQSHESKLVQAQETQNSKPKGNE